MEAQSQSPLMAVLADESEVAFANQVAAAMGYAYADVVMGSPLDACYAINARAESPTYILIDIGKRNTEVLKELDMLAEHCEAGTKVVMLGTVNDVGFYRELRNRGVIEYFTKPAEVADIRTALMSGLQEGNSDGGQVISFISAASGDGASTLALNAAWALATEFDKSTILVDLDYQFGMVAKNLDLSTPFGIKELFEHPERGIDITLVERMIVTYQDRLKIIGAPNELRVLPSVPPELVRDLIMVLRAQYDYVLLDLPHIWTRWIASAISSCTKNVIVAQMWLRSVSHAARLLRVWNDIGVQEDTLMLAINRSGSKFKEELTPKDFERVCTHPINQYITNDTKTIVEAENQGKAVAELGPSLLAQQFAELASQLTGEAMAEPPAASTGSGGLASLFNRG